MRGKHFTIVTSLLVAAIGQAPVQARSIDFANTDAGIDAKIDGGAPFAPMPGVLQCVPFARNISGIHLYGDAHTWWQQAEGKYARGKAPRPGAVMAIRPHGGSLLGHVATVSRVVDARTILISHANWSAPGKIERNVTAVDVSPANDWSEVRVWYAPIQSLGGAHWPVSGFIYNASPGKVNDRKAKAAGFLIADAAPEPAKPLARGKASTMTRVVASRTAKVRFGNERLVAVAPLTRFSPTRPIKPPHPVDKQAGSVRMAAAKRTPILVARASVVRASVVQASFARTSLARVSARHDPIGAILASAR